MCIQMILQLSIVSKEINVYLILLTTEVNYSIYTIMGSY
jgi:hypothetical protein